MAVPPFLIILQDILDTLGSLELALPPEIWRDMVLKACHTRNILETIEHSLQQSDISVSPGQILPPEI